MAEHSHVDAVGFNDLAATVTAYPEVTGTLTYLGPDGLGATVPFDGTTTINTMQEVEWQYDFNLGLVTVTFFASYADLLDKQTALRKIEDATGTDGYALALQIELDALNAVVQALTDPFEIIAAVKTGIDDLRNQSSWT